MSIQVTLTFASEAEMVAYFGAKGSAPAAASTKAEKSSTASTATKTEPAKPKHSREEMEAALSKVKDKSDAKTAKAIINEVGGAQKMAEIPDDKIDAVFDAAEKKIAELEEAM